MSNRPTPGTPSSVRGGTGHRYAAVGSEPGLHTGQIRRMITWEAVFIGLLGAATGIVRERSSATRSAHGLVDHGIAPANASSRRTDCRSPPPSAGCVIAAMLAVLGAGRRASRVSPTRALSEAAVEPRLLGPGRLIGGSSHSPAPCRCSRSPPRPRSRTAAATSELTALFLVTRSASSARSWRGRRTVLGPVGAVSPVGGFLASANLRTATRRFSSASTPLVLTVALSCTLLFSTTTTTTPSPQQRTRATGELAVTAPGRLPPSTLVDVRATPGVRSAVALTPTTLGPSLGVSDEAIPAAIVAGGQGGGLDVGVTAGSLAALHGDAIALGRTAPTRHADVGSRVAVMLGDGTRAHATVVAVYSRALAFGEALLAPELAAGHQTGPLLGTTSCAPPTRPRCAGACEGLAARYPGLQVRRAPR